MIEKFYLTNRWNSNRYNHSYQSGPGSNSSEGVLHIPQNFKTGVLTLDGLVSYTGHSMVGRSYLFTGVQSAYSTASDNRTIWGI